MRAVRAVRVGGSHSHEDMGGTEQIRSIIMVQSSLAASVCKQASATKRHSCLSERSISRLRRQTMAVMKSYGMRVMRAMWTDEYGHDLGLVYAAMTSDDVR